MITGVSTACLYPKPLEESLYDLAVNGIPNVEIFINTHSELKKGFAHGAANLLKRFDVKCTSVHPFTCEMETMMFFSDSLYEHSRCRYICIPRRKGIFFAYRRTLL